MSPTKRLSLARSTAVIAATMPPPAALRLPTRTTQVPRLLATTRLTVVHLATSALRPRPLHTPRLRLRLPVTPRLLRPLTLVPTRVVPTPTAILLALKPTLASPTRLPSRVTTTNRPVAASLHLSHLVQPPTTLSRFDAARASAPLCPPLRVPHRTATSYPPSKESHRNRGLWSCKLWV